MKPRHKFILTVAGQQHVPQCNLALKHLKQFTKHDIVVLSVRASDIQHDNVKELLLPQYDDFMASRYLKTNVCKIIRPAHTCCYIDNDVLAVGDVDRIFNEFRKPVTFATDQVQTVRKFSEWALTDGQHLEKVIASKFDIEVQAGWPILNGGVFLFNRSAEAFLNTWWQYTVEVCQDEGWKKRDQGALIAAIWKHGLQKHTRLAPEFNWIPYQTELQLQCESPRIERDRIRGRVGRSVRFLHFIHKGKEKETKAMAIAEEFLKLKQGIRFL